MERPDELNRNADVEQLKAEISETQAELQQTVAELQERLSPTTLKNQAVDSVREAAVSVRENVRDATVGRVQHMMRGQNPVPFTLIGIGAAWLLMNNRSTRPWRESGYTEDDSSWDNSTSYVSSDDEVASDGRDAYMDDTGFTSDLNSGWPGVRQRASDVGLRTRQQARRVANRARSGWDHLLQDNPLALGIAALAAGAIVGAALPRTETEDGYLGETRDNLVETARSKAQEGVESARTMARETIQTVTGGEQRT
jgi:hypothetical protein